MSKLNTKASIGHTEAWLCFRLRYVLQPSSLCHVLEHDDTLEYFFEILIFHGGEYLYCDNLGFDNVKLVDVYHIEDRAVCSSEMLISNYQTARSHYSEHKTKTNSVALVRKRTIPTERPSLVGEVNANFCG
jgi:hypothetical protein